ncbi:hypothetical protein [Altererythrobacter fulvus]|uniref:hypothetical protein n=1 Tax=Caenibius fulvus TaxID=2126012 RepID=UPI00301802C8
MPHSPQSPRFTAHRAGIACLAALTLLPAAPALAGPPAWDGGWGSGSWGRPSSTFDRSPSRLSSRNSQKDNEGEVDVTRFVVEGDAAAALGKGPVKVVVLSNDAPRQPGSAVYDEAPQAERSETSYGPPGPSAPSPGTGDERENATFEAAVIDQLVQAGYQTQNGQTQNGAAGQLVELRIVHGVAQPAEPPRKPVSGEMDVGVSNRGSMVGLGLNLDFTKPKKALLSTRLEARIRDEASGAVLWEGRADIATREGSEKWTGQAIAAKLAEGLFRKFPGKNGENYNLR